MKKKMKTVIKKSGREVFPFPWINSQIPCPWSPKHERVLIPTQPSENTDKPYHVQIVRRSNLQQVRV